MRKRDEAQKVADVLSKYKYQCKHCGRKEIIGVNWEKRICSNCHRMIYKSEAIEFKDKLEQEIRRQKRDGKKE